MNIGQASRASGISAKMIRHYESIALLPPAARTGAGYRQYGQADVHSLRFIRRARDLGFAVEEIRRLLDLWQDRRRTSQQVRALAQRHIDELERRAQALQAMRSALQHLVDACQGDERPECPILDTLALPQGDAATPSRGAAAPRAPQPQPQPHARRRPRGA